MNDPGRPRDFHLPDGTFEVVPHDPRWAVAFDEAREVIATALPGVGVHHIGSTSVPGLWAKPTVDILVTLGPAQDATDVIRRLEAAGFEHRPASFPDEVDHLFFRKVGPACKRSHHLHVLREGSERVRDYLAFRDLLRSDARALAEYEAVKRRLAASSESRAAYTDGKAETVQRLLARARRLYSSPRD